MLTYPDSQSLFAKPELAGQAGDRPVRGLGIGLSVDDELDGTSRKFVSAFHWQERIAVFQSPCLYYPRSNTVSAGEFADPVTTGLESSDNNADQLRNIPVSGALFAGKGTPRSI